MKTIGLNTADRTMFRFIQDMLLSTEKIVVESYDYKHLSGDTIYYYDDDGVNIFTLSVARKDKDFVVEYIKKLHRNEYDEKSVDETYTELEIEYIKGEV